MAEATAELKELGDKLAGLTLGAELAGLLVDDGDLVARGDVPHRARR